jgi:hypothetical protein
VQVAGLINAATRKLKGTQISGLINYAKNIEGAQIGFINLSDSCSGIPIGFLSFVNKGYHKIEVGGDEVFPINVAFRSGVKRFYTILSAGMQLQNTDTITWNFGYGIGTSVMLNKKWSSDFDLTMHQVVVANRIGNFNPLAKFSVMMERKLSHKFSIAIGPILNMHWINKTDPDYALHLKELAPYSFYKQKRKDNYEANFWVGGKLCLRIF